MIGFAGLPDAKLYGGGIYNAGALKVEFTTVITNDAATAGGGIYSVGAIHLYNNLFSGNKPSEVLCPVITSVKAATNEVVSAGELAVTDMVSDTQCNPPMPTPICFEAASGLNPVPYFIPCDKSASINAANCQDSKVKVDLRGSTRKQNKCDLGSIERGVSLLATVAFTESLVPDLVVRSVTIEPKGELVYKHQGYHQGGSRERGQLSHAPPFLCQLVYQPAGDATQSCWGDMDRSLSYV